jgi:HD-like signal output (HDOD) protein
MNEIDTPVAAFGDDRIVAAARALGAAGGAVATRIMSTLQRDDVEPREVAELVELEPTLAARVLKVANSAYYGRSGSIGTIDGALAVLGLNAVKGIAAAACLDRMLPGRGEQAAALGRQLARHGLASAAAAQLLARRSAHAELAHDAFMAAILHDLGVAIQHRLDAAGLTALSGWAAGTGRRSDADALRQAEMRFVGATHERCAQVAFASWNLPAALSAVAASHHAPLEASGSVRPLAALVHLGHRLATQAGHGVDSEPAEHGPVDGVLAAAGVSADAFESVAQALPDTAAALIAALAAP